MTEQNPLSDHAAAMAIHAAMITIIKINYPKAEKTLDKAFHLLKEARGDALSELLDSGAEITVTTKK